MEFRLDEEQCAEQAGPWTGYALPAIGAQSERGKKTSLKRERTACGALAPQACALARCGESQASDWQSKHHAKRHAAEKVQSHQATRHQEFIRT
jgi:hypothetical protein